MDLENDPHRQLAIKWKNELQAKDEALEAATYYIDRLETALRGKSVRDLAEAAEAWKNAKKV